MVNDIISDTLTRIRNANLAKHKVVQVPSTQITKNIIKVLQKEGFIQNFNEIADKLSNYLIISLKYKGKNKQPIITALQRISKPSLRVYANHKELPKVLGGIGVALISTSEGIISDREARQAGLGGEVLCYIW